MSIRGYIKKGKPANWLSVRGAQPVATAKRQAKPTKARKPIRPASKRNASEKNIYRAEARQFVAEAIARGALCPVVLAVKELREGHKYGYDISATLSECHHKYGRVGRLLRWQPGWIAMSKQGHRWCHQNVAEATRRGWFGPAGTWNDYERAVFHEAHKA